MDITFLRVASTLVSFATFLGILAWVYLRRDQRDFEEAAQLPFEQD
ncbi:cbb3-type cytochrome C oxidase subunit 3 [Rhodoferax koreense]|uniref:Cbb3-type cytochrome C oxidase subunit 3 n=1 Tax=Rhodoferax koreensis TaxID=1842727 RepID=A0A1P8K3Q4_9BURK|nr:cbb3-type cytochrome c oxidase subunit 3 [Rhodoferax koreense]APW40571.1 cbb3-type cytochrome C oxidase subunit 3 [Rhodoferax koreense]